MSGKHYFRPFAFFAVLSTLVFAAFSTFFVVAGTRDLLAFNTQLVRIDTSKIGSNILKDLRRRSFGDDVLDTASNAADKAGDAADTAKEKASDAADTAKDKVNEGVNKAKQTVNDLKNKFKDGLAELFDLRDFYSIYVTDYCYGDITDGAYKVDKCGSDGSKSSGDSSASSFTNMLKDKIDSANKLIPSELQGKFKIPDEFTSDMDTATGLFKLALNTGWFLVALSSLLLVTGVIYMLGMMRFLIYINAVGSIVLFFVSIFWVGALYFFVMKFVTVVSSVLSFLSITAAEGTVAKTVFGVLALTSLTTMIFWNVTLMAVRRDKKKARQYNGGMQQVPSRPHFGHHNDHMSQQGN